MKYPNGAFNPFTTHDEWIKKNLTCDTPLNHLPTIPQFYANREIFVTGFSGFVGKVLIEKLLRACPDVKAIYVLLRAKKGQSIDERMKDITEQVVFDVLRQQNPNFTEKIIPIEGDVMELNLGISVQDMVRIKDVSIVFHSAASVRFDDTLKYAVLVNARGTREVMKLSEKFANIKVVMHVSTTYSNAYLDTVEEKIYPPLADWEQTIKICEQDDQNLVDVLTQHFINFMPNTYVFSKNLAEHVTCSYREKLPIIVFRPSIVLSAFQEPFGGYVREDVFWQ
jgi:fatty acyl-CoA reductase